MLKEQSYLNQTLCYKYGKITSVHFTTNNPYLLLPTPSLAYPIHSPIFLTARNSIYPFHFWSRNGCLGTQSQKALGLAMIQGSHINHPALVGLLHTLFSACFDSAIVPSECCSALIHPIMKPNSPDPRNPANYSGICNNFEGHRFW